MKWSIALSFVVILLAFLSIHATVIPVASGMPEEAVGRVVTVISGDSLGIEMLIPDPRTNNVDSIKLADITSPSTVTPEGKAAQKYAYSLLWNKTVYLDIDDNTTSGRNEWSQLICVVYLIDSEYRPIWPPANRIIVDMGYAKVDDDTKNEFDPGAWWKEPTIPEGPKESQLKNMSEEKAMSGVSAGGSVIIGNATNSSVTQAGVMSYPGGASGGSVTIGNTMKSSVMQKDSKTGQVRIGYRA